MARDDAGRGQHLQFGDHARAEVREQPEVLGAPRARLVVDRAQRPDRLAVGRAQRDAGVRDDAELLDRRVGRRHRIDARVGERVRLVGGDDERAEPGGDRHLARRRPRLRALAADEALLVGADQVHEHDRHVEDAARRPGDPVQRLRRRLGVGLQLRKGPQPAGPAQQFGIPLPHVSSVPRASIHPIGTDGSTSAAGSESDGFGSNGSSSRSPHQVANDGRSTPSVSRRPRRSPGRRFSVYCV